MVSRIALWSAGFRDRYSSYSKTRKRLTVWALYTGIFLFGILLAFSILLAARRTIVWTYDSSSQYYPGMVYFAQALKRFFAGLANGQWIWPQYDFSIAFGEDIISSLSYYGFGDPMNLLAALFPRALMEQVFVLLVFLRAYLAGLFFYLYIRWFGVGRGKALLGAVSYALCGYATSMIVGHQIFLNAIMYLPLILLGFERLLAGRRPVLLPLATALFTFTGYYMLFMVSVFLVMYAVFRFFRVYPAGEARSRRFFNLLGTAVLYYALGVFLAGAMLLPAVWGFLHRITQERSVNENLLFYSLREYLGAFSRLIFLDGDNSRAVSVWSFAAMLLSVTSGAVRRRHAGGTIAVCVLICLAVPFFGSMFNGFSYVTDRWTYFLSFLSACALSILFDDLLAMKRTAWIALISAVIALLSAFAYTIYARRGALEWEILLFIAYAVLVSAVSLAALRIAQKVSVDERLPLGARRMFPLMLAALIVAGNLGANGVVQNFVLYRNGNFIRSGGVDRLIESSPAASVEAPQGSDFFRVEIPMAEWSDRNEAMLLGVNGTACYLSVLNENPISAVSKLESSSRTLINQVLGLDQREALLALMNVRYYAKREDSPQRAPYGFTFLKKDGKTEVYENRNVLPLGYSTAGIISDEDYETMTGLERQQALLTGAVLHGDFESTALPTSGIQKVEYSVLGMDEMEWADGVVRAGKNPAMMLGFASPGGTETYLRLTGLDIKGGSGAFPSILVTGEGFEKKVVINGKNIVHSHGGDVYLVNLGFHEEPLTAVTLNFPAKKTIALDAIEVLSVPMAGFEESIAALRAQPMTDVVLDDDRIEGKVSFDAERTLVIGVPYSEGWIAAVDGKRTPIDPSNGLSMAFRLPAGAHHVVLTYENPWQKAGILLSLVALVALIALWMIGLRFGVTEGKRKIHAAAPGT